MEFIKGSLVDANFNLTINVSNVEPEGTNEKLMLLAGLEAKLYEWKESCEEENNIIKAVNLVMLIADELLPILDGKGKAVFTDSEKGIIRGILYFDGEGFFNRIVFKKVGMEFRDIVKGIDSDSDEINAFLSDPNVREIYIENGLKLYEAIRKMAKNYEPKK